MSLRQPSNTVMTKQAVDNRTRAIRALYTELYYTQVVDDTIMAECMSELKRVDFDHAQRENAILASLSDRYLTLVEEGKAPSLEDYAAKILAL